MPSLGTVWNKFANKRLKWGYFVQSNGKFIILRLQDIHVAEQMLKLELNTNQSVYQFCYLIGFFKLYSYCILYLRFMGMFMSFLCILPYSRLDNSEVPLYITLLKAWQLRKILKLLTNIQVKIMWEISNMLFYDWVVGRRGWGLS